MPIDNLNKKNEIISNLYFKNISSKYVSNPYTATTSVCTAIVFSGVQEMLLVSGYPLLVSLSLSFLKSDNVIFLRPCSHNILYPMTIHNDQWTLNMNFKSHNSPASCTILFLLPACQPPSLHADSWGDMLSTSV